MPNPDPVGCGCPCQAPPLANKHPGQAGHCLHRETGRLGELKNGPFAERGRWQGGVHRPRPCGQSPNSATVHLGVPTGQTGSEVTLEGLAATCPRPHGCPAEYERWPGQPRCRVMGRGGLVLSTGVAGTFPVVLRALPPPAPISDCREYRERKNWPHRFWSDLRHRRELAWIRPLLPPVPPGPPTCSLQEGQSLRLEHGTRATGASTPPRGAAPAGLQTSRGARRPRAPPARTVSTPQSPRLAPPPLRHPLKTSPSSQTPRGCPQMTRSSHTAKGSLAVTEPELPRRLGEGRAVLTQRLAQLRVLDPDGFQPLQQLRGRQLPHQVQGHRVTLGAEGEGASGRASG